MKDFQASILDIFAYLMPGAVTAAAVVVPLSLAGIMPWPEIGLGDAVVALIIFYVLGVLSSSLRPARFRASPTGTEEKAYKVELKNGQAKAVVQSALKHYFGERCTLSPWAFEKHILVRFFVESRSKEAGEFIRRQSALRQLRYNLVVPILLLGGGLVACWFKLAPTWWLASVQAAATVLISGAIVLAVYRAAQGNIHREVMYVWTALGALYILDTGGGDLVQSAPGTDGRKEETGIDEVHSDAQDKRGV